MYLIHTGEKPYEFLQFNKTFTRNTHLRDYEKIHSRKKNFECEYFHKKFIQKCNLKTHIQIHILAIDLKSAIYVIILFLGLKVCVVKRFMIQVTA